MKTLNVMYICDDGFASIAGVSMTSLFENNPANLISINIYLLIVNVSEENCHKFRELAEKYKQNINIIDASEQYKKIERLQLSSYRGSSMTNLRLCFERMIPQSVQKLLYIDCDTIICSSLEVLVDYDMHGKMLGMVLDAYARLIKLPQYKQYSYYNAGVILFDCNRWRKEQWGGHIIRFVNKKGVRYAHPDQDIYNIIFKDEIFRLPVKFNFQPVHKIYPEKLYFKYLAEKEYYTEKEIQEAREQPCIIHMIRVLGENPWYNNNCHPDKERFIYYKKKSYWKETDGEKNTSGLIIKTEKLLSRILPADIFFPISLLGIWVTQKYNTKNL